MAQTVQDIFTLAIHLMNEGDDETGLADTADNKEFRFRAVPILNLLQQECLSGSDTVKQRQAGVRSVLPVLRTMEDVVELDDGICLTVLPYGLAAYLVQEINPEMSQKLLGRYQKLLLEAKRQIPAVTEDILRPYGGTEHSQYSRWGMG